MLKRGNKNLYLARLLASVPHLHLSLRPVCINNWDMSDVITTFFRQKINFLSFVLNLFLCSLASGMRPKRAGAFCDGGGKGGAGRGRLVGEGGCLLVSQLCYFLLELDV